jgi:hypothetical protein
MVAKTFLGKERKFDLTNSDLIMLNKFFYTLKEQIYTPMHYQKFMEEINTEQAQSKVGPN